jgi:hypothetical protein
MPWLLCLPACTCVAVSTFRLVQAQAVKPGDRIAVLVDVPSSTVSAGDSTPAAVPQGQAVFKVVRVSSVQSVTANGYYLFKIGSGYLLADNVVTAR